jgi:putative transcriptional regulator
MDSVENRLRTLRLTRGLSQEELAQSLGVTRQSVLAIENGKYLPSIGLALKIARFFDMPLESIFWLSDSNK